MDKSLLLRYARKLTNIGKHNKSLDQLLKEASTLFDCYSEQYHGAHNCFELQCSKLGSRLGPHQKEWRVNIVVHSIHWRALDYCTTFPGDTPEEALQLFLDYVDQKNIKILDILNLALENRELLIAT